MIVLLQITRDCVYKGFKVAFIAVIPPVWAAKNGARADARLSNWSNRYETKRLSIQSSMIPVMSASLASKLEEIELAYRRDTNPEAVPDLTRGAQTS